MAGRLFGGTLLATALVTLAVLLREIGTLLSRIEGAGQAFGPSVFTGPAPRFWETEEIRAAGGYGGLWHQSKDVAGPLVSWHLSLDLLFAPLLALTLYVLLVLVSEALPPDRVLPELNLRGRMLIGLPAGYLVADLIETVVTSNFLGCDLWGGTCSFDASSGGRLVQALSDLKWLLLLIIVVAIVVMFLWRTNAGSWSWQRGQATREYRRRTPVIVVGPPVGLAVVVGLFLLLVALPAGGPLDQMPDVLRALLDRTEEDGPGPALKATFYLGLFVICVMVAAVPGTRESSVARQPPWLSVLAASAAVSVALAAFHLATEGDLGMDAVPVLALPIVVVVAAAAAWVFGTLAPPAPAEAAAPPKCPRPQGTPPPPADPEPYDLQVRAWLLTALLVAGIVLGAALGVIRAAAPLVLVDDRDGTLLRAAVAIGIGGPAVMAALVVWLLSAPPPWWNNVWVARIRWALVGLAVLVVGIRAAQLTRQPEDAATLGTPATLTVILAALSLFIGLVGLLSRKVRWKDLENLRVGDRTPWMALLVVAWLVAGWMNTQGGYHDVRTLAVTEDQQRDDANVETRSLEEAMDAWASQWSSSTMPDTCLTRDGHVPLVLVAAPGGGGKAAYWTATGMDQVFGPQGFCPGSLFAVAGVSGGAVGLATRLAIGPGSPGERLPSADEDGGGTRSDNLAGPVVSAMTDDGPLAATIAAMMLRDLPAPMVAARSAWRDRAAVLEDMWASAADDVFDSTTVDETGGGEGAKPVEELGRRWWLVPNADETDSEAKVIADAAAAGPVLLLVGSSVNDGCRALVSNVRGLPIGAGSCMQAPATKNGASVTAGSVPASVDVLDGLGPSVGIDGDAAGTDPGDLCETENVAQTIRATSAALLAARFPYVTPSGALRSCPPPDNTDDPRTTHVVDGGYLENTGLLTLLQTWDSVAQRITLCNDADSDIPEVTADPKPHGRDHGRDHDEPGYRHDKHDHHAHTHIDQHGHEPEERGQKHDDTVQNDPVQEGDETSADMGCPERDGEPLIVEPFLVMLENHYRSEAVAPVPARPRELFIPPSTLVGKRATTLGTYALEQLAASVVSRAYGVAVPACNRFIQLSPQVQAAVQAPLGWVLASSTRDRMDQDLEEAMRKALPATSEAVPKPSLPLRECS